MRTLLLIALLLAAPAFAVDCPSPKVCVDPCENLSPNTLPGPPDGIGGEVPQENACAYHKPIEKTFRDWSHLLCGTSRCVLNLDTLVILGGSPSVGDCLVCAEVTGGDCTAAEWTACTVP